MDDICQIKAEITVPSGRTLLVKTWAEYETIYDHDCLKLIFEDMAVETSKELDKNSPARLKEQEAEQSAST